MLSFPQVVTGTLTSFRAVYNMLQPKGDTNVCIQAPSGLYVTKVWLECVYLQERNMTSKVLQKECDIVSVVLVKNGLPMDEI